MGQVPHQGLTEQEVRQGLRAHSLQFHCSTLQQGYGSWGRQVSKLLASCLSYDTAQRPAMAEVHQQLLLLAGERRPRERDDAGDTQPAPQCSRSRALLWLQRLLGLQPEAAGSAPRGLGLRQQEGAEGPGCQAGEAPRRAVSRGCGLLW